MNLTSEALRLARNAMIDIVGCMIAGANDEATSCAKKAILDLSSGSARLVGSEAYLAAPHAALVNGTAARPRL